MLRTKILELNWNSSLNKEIWFKIYVFEGVEGS